MEDTTNIRLIAESMNKQITHFVEYVAEYAPELLKELSERYDWL